MHQDGVELVPLGTSVMKSIVCPFCKNARCARACARFSLTSCGLFTAVSAEAKDALGSTRVELIATANTNTGCVTPLTAELERLPQTSQI